MRAAPLRWLAWLLVVVIGYGLYQRLATTPSPSPAQVQALDAQAAAAEQRLARLRAQTEATDKQIDESIAKVQSHEADRLARAVFINDIAPISMLKTALAECYYNDGVWPTDGCGLDLAQLRGESLQHVEIEPGGVIVMSFVASRGLPDVSLRLAPEIEERGIRWLCSSSDYAAIEELLPDCRFRP